LVSNTTTHLVLVNAFTSAIPLRDVDFFLLCRWWSGV
jgi:hypothetical protein